MKKAAKIWLIAAASLVFVGGALFAGVMTKLGWNFEKLSTVNYVTNTYEVDIEFGDISLKTDTADIIFAPSGDGKCRVECYEEENAKHTVTADGGVLSVTAQERRAWYDYIGFYFGTPRITVYLPESEYGTLTVSGSVGKVGIPKGFAFDGVDISLSTGNVEFCASAAGQVKIKTTTGDIRAENIFAGSLDLSVSTGTVTVSGVSCGGDAAVSVSTGKAYLTDVSCKNVISNGSTGNISLDGVIADEKLSVERSTGEVSFDGCDAAEIYVKTSTGDVAGSFLTDKVFITDTGTGSVDVPKTSDGGKCEISTATGNIKFKIG